MLWLPRWPRSEVGPCDGMLDDLWWVAFDALDLALLAACLFGSEDHIVYKKSFIYMPLLWCALIPNLLLRYRHHQEHRPAFAIPDAPSKDTSSTPLALVATRRTQSAQTLPVERC